MAEKIKNKLGIGSYNCQHFKEVTVDYMIEAITKCHFLFIQEHCLFLSELSKFDKLGSINYHGNSAMREDQPVHGHHHGGCAIIWRDDLDCKVDPLNLDNNRLCGVKVTFPNELTMLLLNVYMPCDERYAGPHYDVSVTLLNDIACTVEDANCDVIVFGGDLNADLKRLSPHVTAVKNMLQTVGLKSGIEHVLSKVDYTFESKGSGVRSVIDHLCFSDNIFHSLTEYTTLKSVENTSDHDVLVCCVDIEVSDMIKVQRKFSPRSAWYKATAADIELYKYELDCLLSNVSIPLNAIYCQNMQCDDHESDIDTFYNDIINACLVAERDCIPQTGHTSVKRIPGWNEYVISKRKVALYFHDLWKKAGRPSHGDIATNMRQSRKDYHYAIRFCKRERYQIQARRMAEAFAKKDNRNFWREVRQFKQKASSAPLRVDSAQDPQSISDLFHDKFKEIYTSVPYDPQEMADIKRDIDQQIHRDSLKFTSEVSRSMSVSNIQKLVSNLKSGKHDGSGGVVSDCILHASLKLTVFLSMLFKMIAVHSHIPDDLLVGTMIPLPKDRGLTMFSDKYRAITLSGCVLKLIDMLILSEDTECMKSDILQYGFKQNSSTTLCTFTMYEICELFTHEKSDVYCLLLDASKAFDRVSYSELFKILMKKGMNAVYIRLLFKLYTNQRLRINWQSHMSKEFNVTNGVRQGGVLSPALFALYLDVLLQRLRKSGFGCYIGPHFAGALAYADDIALLSPTRTGLEAMSKICEEFALDYKLMFNGNKSQYVVFRSSNCSGDTHFSFCGAVLSECKAVIHLGHKLYSDRKSGNVDGIIASFYRQYNMFRSRFGDIPSSVQCELFYKYCSSFYGCLLLRFKSSLKKLQVTWRKALRRVWKIPNTTHCAILRGLHNGLCDKHVFISRFMKFVAEMLRSGSTMTQYLFKRLLQVPKSVLNQNLSFCVQDLDIPFNPDELIEVNTEKMVKLKCSQACKAENCAVGSVVKELCDVRDNLKDCELTKDEVIMILRDLCVN